jgi:hypothetical protein
VCGGKEQVTRSFDRKTHTGHRVLKLPKARAPEIIFLQHNDKKFRNPWQEQNLPPYQKDFQDLLLCSHFATGITEIYSRL